MKLTKNFKKIFIQSLLDSYNIHCESMELVIQYNFVRYALKGHRNQEPFTGSLNIVSKSDGICHFTVTGWLDNHDKLINEVTKDNPYIKAISEVSDFLSLHFNRNILTKNNRIFIGMGHFSYRGRSISDIFINMNPAILRQLDIEQGDDDDNIIVTYLLEYDLFYKDNKPLFNYKSKKDHVIHFINDDELESFKKFLIYSYMTAHAEITLRPNLLTQEQFDTLSYQHILDYLIVQDMQNI